MVELVWKNATETAQVLADRLKAKRKKLKLSQQELSARSGVSYGSVKRFEQTGEIALVSLIKITKVLACDHEIEDLFTSKTYASIQEVLDERNR